MVDRGGKGLLLGGFNEFCEYAKVGSVTMLSKCLNQRLFLHLIDAAFCDAPQTQRIHLDCFVNRFRLCPIARVDIILKYLNIHFFCSK